MLSNDYNVENVGLDEYDDLIDHMHNTCKEERFTPNKYLSIVTVEFITQDNQIVTTDIKPNNEQDLKHIINEIIKKRPVLKYNQLNEIKLGFISHPIKSMLAIQMLKNDVRQRIKNKKMIYINEY